MTALLPHDGWTARTRLSGARVAASLLPPDAGLRIDRDGFALVDLDLSDGRIGAVRMHDAGSIPEDGLRLEGAMLFPGFLDMHTHLDKGHIWARMPNPDGTHAGAAASVARDRQANWTEADVAARFEFGLLCAHAHGTVAIRTHLDSHEIAQARTSWSVFRRMQTQWHGRIRLQGVVMARLDAYGDTTGPELAELAAQTGGLLGGILKFADPRHNADPDAIDDGLDRLLRLATDRQLDIDLHVDETGDAGAGDLAAVARAVLRNRFRGTVSCGHCCALSIQPEHVLRDTIALVRDAGLTIVSLPMVNAFLQDRVPGRTPRWRGIAPVQELAAAGVRVVAASDNCRDPFFMFGDHDMLETFRSFARLAHLDAALGDWSGSVTAEPARVMGETMYGRIVPGHAADLVLFRARSGSELLSRPHSDRLVIRGGRLIEARVPDYAVLDAVLRGQDGRTC